jgi:hypothetical protein
MKSRRGVAARGSAVRGAERHVAQQVALGHDDAGHGKQQGDPPKGA